MVVSVSDAGARLLAGFGKVEISASAKGAELVGYPYRGGGALSVRDPLFARALVMQYGTGQVAICSLDVLYVNEDIVEAARTQIANDTGIRPERVFVSASHTHSGPFDDDPACWPEGLHAKISESVAEAQRRLEPARIGAGFGMLYGHSLNRRRLEDPVDPAVFVMRIDDMRGRALGAYYGFGCHPVVLGPDIRHVSGDWVSSAARTIESALGGEAVAVFGQGASGDVNPLTGGVRKRFAESRTVQARIHELPLAGESHYYGNPDGTVDQFDIGDRTGGSFAEAGRLGKAVAAEVLRVHRGISFSDVTGLWTARITAGGSPSAAAGPAAEDPWQGRGDRVRPRVGPGRPLEVMVLAIEGPDIMLVGQPGEVFSETGIGLRRELRQAGIRHPFVVGYANGWRAYLPPARAFPEGGYEVLWALEMGTPESLQEEIRAGVLKILDDRRQAETERQGA
ncbi:hypothetical protein [Mesorhizobium sp. ES1-6]|uniref:hypothetical protein n=1 Tax=Mesorhizobium sp. ES1-6 TaxID=2876626 RepID=UPI001CCDD18E|nr:hypothetical protein [Mesorhizobium sp. ES1-6]MBZ9801143.1 hypothetical protein [Mesorhizobium sp. ES1-6]